MYTNGTPCLICNDRHKGATAESLGHVHQDSDGVGNVRLLIIGSGKVEFCWRCGCRKSGWANIANEVAKNCSDKNCICHTAQRAE